MSPSTQVDANVRQAVPFLRVVNLEESLRFYAQGLGFEMTRTWVHEGRLRWCWLELGGAALMLQEFWDDGRHAGRPEGPLGQGASICFLCRDALALYRSIRPRGPRPSIPFVGNAMWSFSLSDPDGYRIEFESPTDAPEGTEYSEDAPG